jgi:UDP-N-acetylmuramate dehydrogenase
MQVEIKENMPLASLTTLGVGGNAQFFARATSERDVEEAVAFSNRSHLPLFVLGGGSNLVISDHGWRGLAVQTAIPGIQPRSAQGKIVFEVGAGVDWDDFVSRSVSLNCAGIECLSGIPGSVGATPVQNVGAYGQEVSQTITGVMVFDVKENRTRNLPAAECKFSYRTSVFNSTERDRYILLRVSYALNPEGKPALRYADLQKYFAGREGRPTLTEVRAAVRQIRANKGMLISPGDPDSKSAGSFFKNPIVSDWQYQDVQQRAGKRNLVIPSYPALSRWKKIPAAWLVENSGFPKGYVKGQAGISSKHALAIVNRGGASAAEIIALRDDIQTGVEQRWGIHLEAEPVFVGF